MIYNYLCNQCTSPLTLWVRIPLRLGDLNTSLCDKAGLWRASLWLSPHTLVSSTNKIYHHNITEILLKVALNTITTTMTNTVNYMYVLENQIKIPVLWILRNKLCILVLQNIFLDSKNGWHCNQCLLLLKLWVRIPLITVACVDSFHILIFSGIPRNYLTK